MPVSVAGPRGAPPSPVLPALVGTGLLFGGLDNGFGKGLICLIAGMLMIWQLWRENPSPVLVKRLVPILAVFGVTVIWAWWASVSNGGTGSARALTPDLFIHEFVGMAGTALVFSLAAFIGYRRRSLYKDVDWLIAFIAIGLVIGLVVRLSEDAPLFAFWDRTHGERFMGTLNNANVAANVYAVLALLSFCRLLVLRSPAKFRHGHPGDSVRFWLSALSLPAALIAIVSTGSRTTIVTVTAIAVLLVALRAAQASGGYRRRRTLAVAGAMLLLSLLATPLAAIVNSRFGSLQDGASGRWLLWTHYADIAAASPWYGYGLGSFTTVNVRFPGPLDLAQQLWMVNSPHNILIHLLLEAGWPFLLGYLAMAAMVSWTIMVAVLRGWLRLDVAGLLASAAVVLTGAMVDIVLEVPAPTALFLVLVGLCFGQAVRARARPA